MKKEVDRIDATPSKRLFLSIIADYDLARSICELVDNGLDVWVKGGRSRDVLVKIGVDKSQQVITVEDNAGGLDKADLKYIVGPGQTGTSPTDETIGIFGVGTKRAVVALAQDIKISTRRTREKTYQVDFDDDWLQDEDWELPVYEVDNIKRGSTLVELQKLRVQVSDEIIGQLKEHLSATYAKFLKTKKVTIRVNGEDLAPKFFENWAFPPSYSPQKITGKVTTAEGRQVRVLAIAGLSRESSPAAGEYGVYFYCNDRLVARALKTFDVGFAKGWAGLPHPKVSLTRVIVSLNGDARSMPWNSSKSDVNTNHEIFQAIRNWLIQVVKDYASLSRIWEGEWPEKVFKHKTGAMKEIQVDDFPQARRSFLPPLPRSRPRYGERVTKINRGVAKQKPWAKGLYEGIIAADLIAKQRLEQRNRIALIVLDSTLEIGFKEYLVNESGTAYSDKRLLEIFANRSLVHNEVKKYVALSEQTWKKIEYYYRLRCKLVHEKTTVAIGDDPLQDFREVVEKVLGKMYKLRFTDTQERDE